MSLMYGKLDLDTVVNLVDIVGGMEGVVALQNGDLLVVPKDRAHKEGRDIECISVTTNGTNCIQWNERLASKGIVVRGSANEIFERGLEAFPTTKGKKTNLIILKDDPLFRYFGRSRETALKVALQCGWIYPDPEIACYLCERISLDRLKRLGVGGGLNIMHEPVKNVQNHSVRFCFYQEPGITIPNMFFTTCDPMCDSHREASDVGYVFALPDSAT